MQVIQPQNYGLARDRNLLLKQAINAQAKEIKKQFKINISRYISYLPGWLESTALPSNSQNVIMMLNISSVSGG